jgi:N-methylhydantoinase B
MFRSAVQLTFDYSERLAREKIAAIPDGRYVAEATVEAFDPDNAVRFEIAVEVDGTDLTVDYTAAPPQLATPFNLLYASTLGLSRAYVLAVIGGTESANEGLMRPIHVRTTPGTFAHATAPAPVSMYFHGTHAVDAIFAALSQAVPEKVAAPVGAGVQVLLAFGMNEDGTYWGGAFNMTAGQGASPTHDGAGPLMGMGAGDMRAMSCEVFESRAPFVIDRFELARDSAGIGQYRGCPGIDFEFRTLRPLAATILLDGTKHPPGRGFAGGGDGRPNSGVVRHPNGGVTPVTKVAGLPLPAGAVVDVRTGGGGGFGSASARDPERVRKDIAQGYVSPEAALTDCPQAF